MICPCCTKSPLPDQGLLVDAGILIRALELDEFIDIDGTSGFYFVFGRPNNDSGGIHIFDDPVSLATMVTPLSLATIPFNARSHQRGSRLEQGAPPGAACSNP